MKTRNWVGLIGGLALCMLGTSVLATVLPSGHCDDCTGHEHSFDFGEWDRVFNQLTPGGEGGDSDIHRLIHKLVLIVLNIGGHGGPDGGPYGETGWGGGDGGNHCGEGDDCNKGVPEPGILGLLGIGLVGIVLARRRMTA